MNKLGNNEALLSLTLKWITMNKMWIIAIFTFFLFWGCTKKLDSNSTPVLKGALTDIAVKKDSSITLGLEFIDAYDDDGDILTLLVFSGQNYTVQGTTIIPNKGFIGDLYVPVQVTDGDNSSQKITIIVSVVHTVSLFPIHSNVWWEYRDSGSDDKIAMISRLQVKDSLVLEGMAIYKLEWKNLVDKGYPLTYLMTKSDTLTSLYGGYSLTDTLLCNAPLYPYPLAKGDRWLFEELRYNASDEKFFLDTLGMITCTDTASYQAVPAGIFKCYELTVSYDAEVKRKSRSLVKPYNCSALGASVIQEGRVDSHDMILVTQKFYFTAGVGMVKSEITYNGQVLWLKLLQRYSVVDK